MGMYSMPGTSSVSAAAPVMTSMPTYYQQSMPMTTAYYPPVYPAADTASLDYSQGKWFAPGEPLPAGWVVTSHPEGNTAPVEGQAMSELASQSFVITSGAGAAETASKDLPATTTSKDKSSKKKSSKKKKSSAAAEEMASCILASG